MVGWGAGEVDRGVPADRGLHGTAGGGDPEFTLEHGITGGDGQHGGAVPTGGGAPRGEPVGVDPKVRRVVAQPAHGGLHVVQLGGEDHFLAVPVLRCGHSNPGRDEPTAEFAAESAVLV